MTHQSLQAIKRRVKKREDLAATLSVRESELRTERDKNRDLHNKLKDTECEVENLRGQLAEVQARATQEQERSVVHLRQEMEALQRQTAFWMRAIPDPEERSELTSLIEWQLTLHSAIVGLTQSISGRHELIADLQGLERKASLEGRQDDFEKLRSRIEVCYADIAAFRSEINCHHAVIATKVVPMIDRVMNGDYRTLKDEVSLSKEKEDERAVDDQKISTNPIITTSPLPIYQPLTAIDKYELGLVFAGIENGKEIVEILHWLISEDFAKRLSQFILRIEEDSFELRLTEIADLKKWRIESHIRARKLVRYLLEALPIWTSNEPSARHMELRIDREGKLQQFLAILDVRFKQRIADRERLQQAQQSRKAKKQQTVQNAIRVEPQKHEEVASAIQYSGRRVSLHRDLIGKEDQLLDYVPLGHFFGNSLTGRSYSMLKNDGYVSDLEQTLQLAYAHALVAHIEQQISVNGGPQKGRSISGILNHARRIEESTASLPIFTANGDLDKEKAIKRAYDILTTKEGNGAYNCHALRSRYAANRELDPAPAHP